IPVAPLGPGTSGRARSGEREDSDALPVPDFSRHPERRLSMITRRITTTARAPGAQIIAVAMGITLVAAVSRPGWADETLETRQLVQQARFTIENFQADPMMGGFRDLVRRARGVFIAPQLLKAAFVV